MGRRRKGHRVNPYVHPFFDPSFHRARKNSSVPIAIRDTTIEVLRVEVDQVMSRHGGMRDP
ncbi:hypothetical protein M413DRAFT_449820, partial [Hebeloma cylindrosporum]